jgi:hypothetical protein
MIIHVHVYDNLNKDKQEHLNILEGGVVFTSGKCLETGDLIFRTFVAEWLIHRSHTTRPLISSRRRFETCSYRCNYVRRLSVYLRKVGGLSSNTLYNVSEFSLPPIKTDRRHITETLLSMVKLTNKPYISMTIMMSVTDQQRMLTPSQQLIST